MGCPIGQEPLPPDCVEIEEKHRRVIVKGKLTYAPTDPQAAYSPPFSNWYTVVLYPSPVTYLKFKTKEELDQWAFQVNKTYTIKGCLHMAGKKNKLRRVMFDITVLD